MRVMMPPRLRHAGPTMFDCNPSAHPALPAAGWFGDPCIHVRKVTTWSATKLLTTDIADDTDKNVPAHRAPIELHP
jgi:hypothetical protein